MADITNGRTRFRYDQVVRPSTDGVTELSTGDRLVKDGEREILYMPNGDKLTIEKDGSFDLKSKGPLETHSKGDTTTVSHPNGDSLVFSSRGVETVSRGNVIVDILSSAQNLHPLAWKPTPETANKSGMMLPGGWQIPVLELQASK